MGQQTTSRTLIAGDAEGPVLFADMGLSFWGGVDPLTGVVIDHHHPLFGQCISGTLLAIPSGRGSCTGSCVMLELILNGVAPKALIFEQREDILPLGVIIAEEMFGQSLPVVQITPDDFASLKNVRYAKLAGGYLSHGGETQASSDPVIVAVPPQAPAKLKLTSRDQALLHAEDNQALQLAMKIVVRMAGLYGAAELVDVTQAHIDGCIYIGPGGLAFAERLAALGAQVAIPTTLNAISIDRRNWRHQGIDPALGEPAERLAKAYITMGAKASYTCAPYLLDSAPTFGEQIVWAESNAVVFANSVIGARTMKYPDDLDICVAITGRAPLTGCHLPEERRPQLVIDVARFQDSDDSFYPLLGYHIGTLAPAQIPLISGLEHLGPSVDDLKAFGAAFATTSAAPMVHINAITPEAGLYKDIIDALPRKSVTPDDLCESWHSLNSAGARPVDLVAIGNPHASCEEIEMVAALCRDHAQQRRLEMVITCGRGEYDKAVAAGYVAVVEEFGARFVTDTCWCMLTEPVIPRSAQVIMTNSGKYAHYAPGLVGRDMRFGSLDDCVKVACGLPVATEPPAWLAG